MIIIGDTHNFGQHVSVFYGSNSTVVNKPRSVFWEYLLLDPSSELRKLIRTFDAGKNCSHVFDENIGAIPVSSTDGFRTGTADFVEPKLRILTGSDFRQLGGVLAISVAFGITDLHIENVIITNRSLQLVDIECLFWDTQLPSESHLLPRNADQWPKTIFGRARDLASCQISLQEFELLRRGFCDQFSLLIEHSDKIRNFFAERRSTFSQHPIRIILRNTAEYRTMLASGEFPQNLISEELQQLERGDIPYFFGYMGDGDVYFFENPGIRNRVENMPTKFSEKVARAFKDPSALFQNDRLLRVYKQSLLEIVFRMMNRNELPYESDDLSVFEQSGFIHIQTPLFAVRTVARPAGQ